MKTGIVCLNLSRSVPPSVNTVLLLDRRHLHQMISLAQCNSNGLGQQATPFVTRRPHRVTCGDNTMVKRPWQRTRSPQTNSCVSCVWFSIPQTGIDHGNSPCDEIQAEGRKDSGNVTARSQFYLCYDYNVDLAVCCKSLFLGDFKRGNV